MYVPAAFAEPDLEIVFAFIDAHPLGILVTASPESGLLATHLPLVLDRTAGSRGTLRGHVARANPHARPSPSVGAEVLEALVVFSGPDAYVTPSWYASKREHGRVVPTWNYAAVHVYGVLRLVDDPAFVLEQVTRLTEQHEHRRERPWSVSDAPPEFLERQAREIVGVEIPLDRVEAKWKMSQNRSAADIAGVIDGLRSSESPTDQSTAAAVEARRPPSKR